MANTISNSNTSTTTTKVRSLDSSKIIPSKPQLIKEGSDKDKNHPNKKKN